ncbi:hypothetical protein H072_10549 [Dactylellina haptotyla CBS 200.50]|uniref:Ras-GEF domain-containing protein n=1 Tax=Dactylellina haptotyla (strain CBS 200.50) TaxID=1284197 RepID=S8A4D4_DACHA|nr:hypothetical protein H072_10549 [Dactylellina haptotyla CBS 200.50]
MAIFEINDVDSNSERRLHFCLSLLLTRVLPHTSQGPHQHSKMITAAGAGASFCLATPARLRPQNQRNPRIVGAGQPSQTTLGSYNLQRTQSAASNYSQTAGSTYAPSISSPTRADRIPEVTEISKSRPFFPAPISPPPISHPVFRNPSFSASSAALYHDALLHEEGYLRPKSPGSLYSYNTSSSGATARQFSSLSESLEPEDLSDDDGEISPTSPAAPRQFQTYMTSPLPGLPSHVHNSQLDLQAAFTGNTSDLVVLQSDSPTGLEQAHKIADAMTYSLDQSSQEICIVVLGMENSGKSTFIQKYNGSKRMPINGVSQRVYRFDDLRYVVRLVEMDLSALDIRNSNFTWPSLHDGTEIMTADGILVLFDVTDRTSVEKIPDVIDFFFKADIPTLLVASKCDSPAQMRDLQPDSVEELRRTLGVEVMETSSSDAGQSQKRCVSLMLSNIIHRKAEVKAASQANARRRANSSALSGRSVSPLSDPKPSHGRASSELSISVSKSREQPEAGKGHHGRTTRSLSASNGTLLSPNRTSVSTPNSPLSHHIRPYMQDFNPSFGKENLDEDDFSYMNADGATYGSMAANFLRSKSTSAASPHAPHEKLEHSTSMSEVMFDRDNGIQRISSGSGKYTGLAWEDLVDRLLAYPMSRADQDFATVMLCFFRKFAAPVDLLDSILAKFARVNKEESIFLLQMNEKIRILSRLHWWVWECPGDFANVSTRQRTIDFARSLEGNRTFAGMAKDIIAILNQPSIEDEDQIWGKKDTDSHRLSMPSYFIHSPSSPTTPNHSLPWVQPNALPPRNMSIVSTLSLKSGGSDDTAPALHSPHSDRPRKDSYVSTASLSPTLDAQAGMMNISSMLEGLSHGQTSPQMIKEQYSIFMELPDEDIAHELTRIDWTLFSRIKPRDFVRHVSVPAAEKERTPSLKYMNKLIEHFNRVAYWVASIILERPKAKHRARALEKFMNIAWILRHMNNYNSLGAVIAGVNGLAIHRLALTRSLVNETIHKNFMRLELLMGTHKSHFAYRLALENTTTEHIPFIALHRRDLVSADEGNRSFLGDGGRINWRKFQIMGDILLTLTNSQSMPHRDLRPNPMTNQLISDATGTMKDEQLMEGFQELYERSVHLEPSNNPADVQRAKRGWFKR